MRLMRRLAGPFAGALLAALPLTVAAQLSPQGQVTPVYSSVAESCHVLKNVAGALYSTSGYAGQAEWIMVLNLAAAPSNGAVAPVAWAYAPQAGSWSINYGSFPAYFAAGITVCASSTGPLTLTAISTNNTFTGVVQ